MCSSDYQDEQDENYRVTLGADISNTTTGLVFSHSCQYVCSRVSGFLGEEMEYGISCLSVLFVSLWC